MEQTQFTEHQEILMPPPQPELKSNEPIVPVSPKKKTLSRKNLIIVLGILTVFLTIVSFGLQSKGKNGVSNPTPIPITQKPVPLANQDFIDQLNELQQKIMAADPAKIDLAPPQLNFNLDINSN
jgi:hypothetical protein